MSAQSAPSYISKPHNWQHAFLPFVLPDGWRAIDNALDGCAYVHRGGIRVIVTVAVELDSKKWLHVSLSRKDRIPNYEDMKWVKEIFIGNDRYAYQVFAPTAQHVDIHSFCLHLWCCLDGPTLPDFTHGGATI